MFTINGQVAYLRNCDLDDYMTAGTFVVATVSDAATISHMPENTAGRLVVMYGTDTAYYRRQTFFTYGDCKIYSRWYAPGSGSRKKRKRCPGRPGSPGRSSRPGEGTRAGL